MKPVFFPGDDAFYSGFTGKAIPLKFIDYVHGKCLVRFQNGHLMLIDEDNLILKSGNREILNLETEGGS